VALTRKFPFSARRTFDMFFEHLSTPLPDPREFNPDLSLDLSLVLEKVLAKNPDERYGSAGELKGALEAVILG